MSEPPFDLQRAHRWFAVEFNNQAWDLLEKPERTCDEDQQLIHSAHAAFLHWDQVGTDVNRQRAEILLAHMYGILGQAESAMRHARRAVDFSEANGDAQEPFDRATAYGCFARAHACAGQELRARELKQTAIEAAGQIADPEDRKVFDQLLAVGDWHGVD